MACPFDNDPVDEGAALLRRELNIRREMIIRPPIDILAFSDHYLFERYCFIYTHNLIHPYITNRSHALTSQQILHVLLRLFANGRFFLIQCRRCRALEQRNCMQSGQTPYAIITLVVESPSPPPQQSNKDIIHISLCLLYFLQTQELV